MPRYCPSRKQIASKMHIGDECEPPCFRMIAPWENAFQRRGTRVVSEQKMAGLARMRPGQKKVQTFRGEHRSAEWEETAERFYLFEPISGLWRRMAFQRLPLTAKLCSALPTSLTGAPLRSGEDRHNGGAPRRAANAGGFSGRWCRHRGTTGCPDRLPVRAPRPPVPQANSEAVWSHPARAEEEGNENPLEAGRRRHHAMNGGAQITIRCQFEQFANVND